MSCGFGTWVNMSYIYYALYIICTNYVAIFCFKLVSKHYAHISQTFVSCTATPNTSTWYAGTLGPVPISKPCWKLYGFPFHILRSSGAVIIYITLVNENPLCGMNSVSMCQWYGQTKYKFCLVGEEITKMGNEFESKYTDTFKDSDGK